MAFKIAFIIAAIVACVQAGGPAAYSISAPSVDHASVGNTQEHTVKGHYGQSSQSDYSSQVQTAHSQSHVQRSSTSNDAGGIAPHYGGGHIVAAAPVAHAYAAPSASYASHYAPAALSHGYTAPAATYAAHSYAPAVSHGYVAPAVSHGYVAPALSHGVSYATAPAYGHGYAAHGYAAHSYAAPAISYAAPAVAHHSYAAAAPAVSYAHAVPAISHGYAAPAIKVAAAPSYAAGYYGHGGYAAHGLGYAAHYAAPAPAYAAHYAAPVVKAAVAAPALVHASVAGHGVHYGY